MSEASQHRVDMATSQSHASVRIAVVTGAEAGMVTSGALHCRAVWALNGSQLPI